MANLSDYLIAAFTGFASGFLVSIPVGPINISIVNEGARRGFGWAFLIGLGATLGCFSWFTLLSSLVSRGRRRFSTGTLVRMSQFSGASLLIVSLVMGGRLVRLLAHR